MFIKDKWRRTLPVKTVYSYPERVLGVSTMILHLEWGRPVVLRDGSADNLIYTATLDLIPAKPGIYIFGRRYGKNFEALYVGQASNGMRGRIKTQFNNLKLMQHLKNSKSGRRIVLASWPLYWQAGTETEEMLGPIGTRAHSTLSIPGARPC